ncbi:MAG: hypothetical protein EPN93_04465 [Spirochaetes bacterium]|nr:MAG: hypothetical protein EPN93_04465 [Spirochaetota bacterium]
MKKIAALFFVLVLLGPAPGCGKTPDRIPLGTWKYKMHTRGVFIGEAVVTNKREGDRYIISSDLTMGLADVKNTTRHIMTETLDFKPLKYESYNKIDTGSAVQNVDTVAVFKGREIELREGANRAVITLPGDFILDGNYFLAKLIEGGFRKDLEISAQVYDPSIERDRSISMTARSMGRETVEVNGRSMRLIHVSQTIDAVKFSDSYIDEEGVAVLVVVEMLNNRIELVRAD